MLTVFFGEAVPFAHTYLWWAAMRMQIQEGNKQINSWHFGEAEKSLNRCKPDYHHNNAHLRMVAYVWRKLRRINLKLGNAEKGKCNRNWTINQAVLARMSQMFHNPLLFFSRSSAWRINQKSISKQLIYEKKNHNRVNWKQILCY